MHQGPSARDFSSGLIPLRARALPDLVAPVELDDLNSPHTLAILSVSPGAAVLDIGCGPGVVAKALAARGCRVWGLEIDPRRAAAARQHCVEVVEGDVESVNLSEAMSGRVFDAVLCLDVLEHLRDPAATLANAAALLAPGGIILLSIPNVTHGALRLELLRGKFRYRDSGLLDRGHLRFFDAEGLDQLLRQAGCRAETTLRVTRRLDETEFDIDLATVPEAIRTTLESDVDALTYQFFVIAKPARALQSMVPATTLLERQHARIAELSAELDKGNTYARHVEAEFAKKDARLQELEVTSERVRVESERQRAHVDELSAEIERATPYARHLEATLETKNTRVHELEAAIEHIRGEFERQRAHLDALSAESERAAVYARHLEATLETRNAHVRELESAAEFAGREADARTVRLAELGQAIEDLKRLSEDSTAYVSHLESELRRRAGDIAVRDDEMHVLRTHIEKTERAIADRDLRLRIAHDAIAEREAQLRTAAEAIADSGARLQVTNSNLADSHDRASHLSWVLHQPRHRLAEFWASALTHRLPRVHRLLRPLVLATLRVSDDNAESSG